MILWESRILTRGLEETKILQFSNDSEQGTPGSLGRIKTQQSSCGRICQCDFSSLSIAMTPSNTLQFRHNELCDTVAAQLRDY